MVVHLHSNIYRVGCVVDHVAQGHANLASCSSDTASMKGERIGQEKLRFCSYMTPGRLSLSYDPGVAWFFMVFHLPCTELLEFGSVVRVWCSGCPSQC